MTADGAPLVPHSAGDTLRLTGLTRTQGSFTLGPLDLVIPTGSVTDVVGPNGEGNTTGRV